jgi:ABC-type sugar transport system substrate-binding protein
MTDEQYTIGFANLSEDSPFSITVREGLEAAAAQHPDLTIISRDNDLDDERATANIQEFADLPVDLAIIYHINERIGPTFKHILGAIPIICVDIPIALTTYFGVDNRQSGILAGQVLAQWIHERWSSKVDKVLAMIEPRVLEVVRSRVDFTIRTMKDAGVQVGTDDVFYLDCGNEYEVSVARAIPVLERWAEYDRIAIIGFNEESTLGALDAARQIGCEDRVVAVGHGASQLAGELKREHTRLIGAVGYRPHDYGKHLIDLALRILRRESVPMRNYIELEQFSYKDV